MDTQIKSQNKSWDQYFMEMSHLVASKSKDRSTKMGCVIVGQDNEVISTGFNGSPRGIDDSVDARHERPAKYQWTEHSERNAIYNAARIGVSTKGAKIYVESHPCHDCARAIIQAGIVEVVVQLGNQLGNRKDWEQSFSVAKELFEEAGVKIRMI
jgi:dCMP deaminase